ncbi:hypothetical protein EV677_2417 [Herminiimonas fonticola]|uniref:Uncharacterized protein n=1 Tax=Herminiimonas fonticola TaxID=303380 RepID=A0A4R6G8J0_9BURK|nr:hypothetical protein Hfont_2152 [Herminiimonas fonticola]TDN90340.1 hypothetical protein EV677_2417 [Herminiimonas fonticola]
MSSTITTCEACWIPCVHTDSAHTSLAARLASGFRLQTKREILRTAQQLKWRQAALACHFQSQAMPFVMPPGNETCRVFVDTGFQNLINDLSYLDAIARFDRLLQSTVSMQSTEQDENERQGLIA